MRYKWNSFTKLLPTHYDAFSSVFRSAEMYTMLWMRRRGLTVVHQSLSLSLWYLLNFILGYMRKHCIIRCWWPDRATHLWSEFPRKSGCRRWTTTPIENNPMWKWTIVYIYINPGEDNAPNCNVSLYLLISHRCHQ